MIASEPLNLWAQEGGILGLVIFSLLGLVLYTVKQLVSSRKQSEKVIKQISEDAREDRKEAKDERLHTNAEHAVTYNRLAQSLDRLTDQLRHR